MRLIAGANGEMFDEFSFEQNIRFTEASGIARAELLDEFLASR